MVRRGNPRDNDNVLSTVLVIEGTSVRNSIGAVLEEDDFQVVIEDVTRGKHLLQNNAGRFDVLITSEPWRFEPFPAGLRVLYVSDAPDSEFLQTHRSRWFNYLRTPFHSQALLLSIRLLLLPCGAQAAQLTLSSRTT